MFVGDCADHQVSLLECVFGTQKNVFRYPERLCLNKIDPVFCFVTLALARIELEFHELLRI